MSSELSKQNSSRGCPRNIKTITGQYCGLRGYIPSVTYWGLRDYGVDGQLGLEKTPQEFISKMVEVFREVRRVLKPEGTLWLNIGDSYAAGGNGPGSQHYKNDCIGTATGEARALPPKKAPRGLKPKDLVGIPWMLAFALREDGWWLRQDIIWCLSGGTCLYAKTQKGDGPIMVRDLARLDPSTVQLWNGEKWTKALGWSKSDRQGNEIEFVLRSGERISCTPTHKFPTNLGLLEAKDIKIGDCLESAFLPEPNNPKDNDFLNPELAWFIGLYIAEGSKADDTIQVAGHSKEEERWVRLQRIANIYGGYITRTVKGNKMDIRLYGKILNAILDEFVSGRTAKDKCLSPSCWKYSNLFLRGILDGYLSGDAHWEEKNKRWRVGFTRNYNLERDLRTLSARLGFNLTLNLNNSFIGKKKYPSFRGEIKFEATAEGHWNQKRKSEIVKIQKARCREVYDIGVEDEPHLFSLASGILTHNSKPNPMPESVTDRCTKAHEYLFLLTKSAKYYFDQEAVREKNGHETDQEEYTRLLETTGESWYQRKNDPFNGKTKSGEKRGHGCTPPNGRNIRSVWNIATQPFPGSHFAVFPEALVEPCIKAGTSEKGYCEECGKPFVRVVEKVFEKKYEYKSIGIPGERNNRGRRTELMGNSQFQSTGWRPSCDCGSACLPVPGIVCDPFSGAGTVAVVAKMLLRDYFGIELNPEYITMSEKRLAMTPAQTRLF